MDNKELVLLLKRSILLLIIFFVSFILIMNIFKLVNFVIKIDRVIKLSGSAEEEIEPIIYRDYQRTTADNSNDKAKTAQELGFVNQIYSINGTEWGQGLNILIVGSDKHCNGDTRSRSDVIVLLKINPEGKIFSLSIPRDSMIRVQDNEGNYTYDKIGHALYWGGLDYLKEVVEEFTSSKIHKVVVIDNFRSFEAFIAILGGVNIDKYLEGDLAIRWIRNRSFTMGDIERCRRQQVFLKYAIERVWRLSVNGDYLITHFLYDALKRIVYTDITKKELLSIIYNLKKNEFNPSTDYMTAVLPGNFATHYSSYVRRDISYWVPEQSIIDQMELLFYSSDNSQKPIDISGTGILDHYLLLLSQKIKILLNK